MKRLGLVILALLMAIALYWILRPQPATPQYITIDGKTMGTYYSITYLGTENYRIQFDSIFKEYSDAVNTYDSTSELSRFNQTGKIRFKSKHLPQMLPLALDINKRTQGAFEPTLMSLINGWGFGFTDKTPMDSSKVDSLLQYVSMKLIRFDENGMEALKPGVMLDLSAMGEGYGIDLVGKFLEQKGISNYKVEVGGEMRCRGVNREQVPWRIGIENPTQDTDTSAGRIMIIVSLDSQSLSTSGNYRKFFIDSAGNKQPHIIDPRTGYPVNHGMLSASIISTDCVLADAMATACMVLGLEGAKRLLEENPNLEGYFIFNENGQIRTWKSKGFPTIEP